ncbi:MAG: protein kinase [Verrucomicrobiia bacterium]
MRKPSEKLETLFEAVLALETDAQRADYLDRACPDPQLRKEVEELLEAHRNPDSLFAEPTVRVETAQAEGVGTVIGRYKLLEALGEGGFGAVWLAEQKEPVRRKVALKVIKLGMDTRQVVARFEAERQALALMDHPNIARIFDAGTTELGRPYFVMELVRGIPITRFCDENNMATEGRLALFVKVCHAVQHAHQKGVIHRDLKPSNVLVTLHDGVPVPKIIDFGIAKATQQELTDKTIHTLFQQFIGTPAYVSPEQAEMSGLDIDTRSDIYSLGVLLYELLTGRTPFDSKELLASGLDTMRRIIRQQEPVRPSTLLNTLSGEELTTTAKRRGTEAPRLVHSVRGDLDWIVMKCLEKDRTRRYETADGLALDVERHLTHEPVVACPPSTAYRAQKFIRRNKVMATTGMVVATVLVLGVVTSTWQAVRASRLRVKAEASEQKALEARAGEARQRAAAEAERDRARLQAYVGDIKLADTAFRENSLGQAIAALRRHIPKAGETDLRGIEWRYLWHKCRGQQSRSFQHEAEVTCAAVSPDGRWLATESGCAFWIWDATGEGERRALSTGAPVNVASWFAEPEHLAFDPQNRFLATAIHSEVLIWNITDWSKLKGLPATNASLCFSGDGSRLATFGEEGIQVWKTGTWETLVRPGEIPIRSKEMFRCIAMNREASLLAASWGLMVRPESRPEGEVALWRVAQRQALFKRTEVPDCVRLAFSADDHWLAAATMGPPAVVWLWSLPDGKPAATWPASPGAGRAVAFAPGGNVLATAGTDPMIRLWDTGDTNRAPRLLPGHLSRVNAVKFATDGHLISASSDKTACLWNVGQSPAGPAAFSLPRGRLICAQRADARRMVTVNLTNLTFEHWDMESGQCLRQTRIQDADALLHHGTLLNGQPLQTALGGSWFVSDPEVWHTNRVRFLFPLPDLGSPAWDLGAFTGDGRVYAWNAESAELVYSNKVASGLLAAFPVADHKKLVLVDAVSQALADWRGTVSSYDQQTYQTELIEEHAQLTPYSTKASPDGRLFAFVTTSGEVKVWDAASQQTRSIAKLATTQACIEFSPNSRWLAAAALGQAQVWDTRTAQLAPLSGDSMGTLGVRFSADSQSLVTYSMDGTGRIWNIATGREMMSGLRVNWFLVGHMGWNLLAPDGNSVLESEGEEAIRVVRLPTLAEIDVLEARAARKP